MIDAVSRKSTALKLVLLVPFLLASAAYAQTHTDQGMNHLSVVDLKCEYATNPIGLDTPSPQLSWRIESDKRMVLQDAYQILVSDSPEGLAKDVGNVWDSGKIKSSHSSGIAYRGKALASRACYYWKVKVWDSNQIASAWSDPASFEMGLTQQEDWKGDWVGVLAGWSGKALYFKRTFTIPKDVKRARMYISGIGYYKLELNGTKVGDHVLDPAISEYAKRVYYATYDVARYLTKDNVMVVTVGQGWYGIPKLRLQMEMTYTDGTTETITSTDVRNVTTGPIIRSSIYDGEYFDARADSEDLHTTAPVNTINRQWAYAQIVDAPGGRMASQQLEPIKVVNTILPQNISETSPGIYVIDAGQNLAGWASLKVKGERGTVITLRFAETLYANGTVNQENLRAAEAKDTYVLKGGGVEEQWEPSFTYHGFRYIQVEGFPYRPKSDDIQIRVVRSSVEPTGKFTCSNELLNRIHKMVVATESSNLHGVPTDCPQRDERMGWLNDLTVRIEQALYNFDLSRFYAKFIDDVQDTQGKDGTITCTAPFRYGSRPADPVSASYLLLALKSYQFYGNEEIIRKHYDGLKAWVDYLNSRTENGIVNYSYYGDWSPPVEYGQNASAVSKFTPGLFMSTGYLYYCSKMISQMAAVLGKTEDEATYRKLADKTAAALNDKYWDKKTGGYASNNQACNSFALFLGVVAKDRIPRVMDNLVKDVKAHNYHLTTGNLCTKYLMEMLTEHGHPEVAFRIATQETYPSWGFMLAKGATTLWERWEFETGGAMNSHNHPMMGSVDSWFYKYVLGIVPDIDGPGFEKLTIRPCVIADLDSAEGEVNTVKGPVKCSWKKENGSFLLNVTVPCNSTATVFVPTKDYESVTEGDKKADVSAGVKFLRTQDDYAVLRVGSGTYHFRSAW